MQSEASTNTFARKGTVKERVFHLELPALINCHTYRRWFRRFVSAMRLVACISLPAPNPVAIPPLMALVVLCASTGIKMQT